MKQKSFAYTDLDKLDEEVNKFEKENKVEFTQSYGEYNPEIKGIVHVRVLFFKDREAQMKDITEDVFNEEQMGASWDAEPNKKFKTYGVKKEDGNYFNIEADYLTKEGESLVSEWSNGSRFIFKPNKFATEENKQPVWRVFKQTK